MKAKDAAKKYVLKRRETAGFVDVYEPVYEEAFLAGAAFAREQENERLKSAIKVMEYYQHDDQIGQRARDFLKEMRNG